MTEQSMNSDAVNADMHEKPQLVKEEKDPLPDTNTPSGNEAVDVASVRGGCSWCSSR